MKVIIRSPNWVGDAVMALPVMQCARQATDADYVAVMARNAVAPLFRNMPEVDRTVTIDDKSSPLLGPRQAAAAIKDDQYDIGLILPPSFSSALIFKLAGVKGRIGYATDKRSLLLTRAIPIPSEKRHRARQYQYLLDKITGRPAEFHDPQLPLSHENIAQGKEVLAPHALTYDDHYLAIAPRAIAPSRRWGAGRYGRLATRLAAALHVKIVLIGTAGDFDDGEKAAACDRDHIINLCGKTDLLSAAAILSFARLFIGNDSGLAHLAGAVGCPLVVLSGPDDPAETSPLCSRKEVIIKDIDCISCVRNDCPKKGDDFMRCMTLISEDDVYEKAIRIIKT